MLRSESTTTARTGRAVKRPHSKGVYGRGSGRVKQLETCLEELGASGKRYGNQ